MSSVDRATLPIESSAGAATPAAPDWSTLDIELHCPRCGYNLKMLTSPRCPECGLTFEWDEIIRATRNELHVPIFEYQWRKRPVQSFFGTILRCMFPWLLWRRIPLAARARFGSLAACCTLALVLCIAVVVGMNMLDLTLMRMKFKSPRMPLYAQLIPLYGIEVAKTALASLPLVVLTTIGLQLFFQTLRRARIQLSHLVRVAAYVWVGALTWLATLEILTSAEWWIVEFVFPAYPAYTGHLPAPEVAVGAALLSLTLAARFYLRIRWAEVIVIVVVLLEALATLTAVAASGIIWNTYDNPIAAMVERAVPVSGNWIFDWVMGLL